MSPMLIIDTILVGGVIGIITTLYFLIRNSGKQAERKKQIEQENAALKESKQDVEDIKADQINKYSSDIDAAHDRLRPYTRD